MNDPEHFDEAVFYEYIDGEMTDSAEFEAHLASCEGCRARLAGVQALFADVAALPELSLAVDLSTAVVAQLAESKTSRVWQPNETGRVWQPNETGRVWRRLIALQLALLPVIGLLFWRFGGLNWLPTRLSMVQAPVWTQWQALALRLGQQMARISDVGLLFDGFDFSVPLLLLGLAGASLVWLVGNRLLLSQDNEIFGRR